jgi:hypothetical protein
MRFFKPAANLGSISGLVIACLLLSSCASSTTSSSNSSEEVDAVLTAEDAGPKLVATGLFDECEVYESSYTLSVSLNCSGVESVYGYSFYFYESRGAMTLDHQEVKVPEDYCTDDSLGWDISSDPQILGENWRMLDGDTDEAFLEVRPLNYETIAKALGGQIMSGVEVFCSEFGIDPVSNPEQREGDSSNVTAWYPEGYNSLSVNSTFAIQWVQGAEDPCGSAACTFSTMNIVSQSACPGGVYVEVNFLDSSGTVIDWSNDVVPALDEGQVAQLQFSSFESAASGGTTRVVTASCN